MGVGEKSHQLTYHLNPPPQKGMRLALVTPVAWQKPAEEIRLPDLRRSAGTTVCPTAPLMGEDLGWNNFSPEGRGLFWRLVALAWAVIAQHVGDAQAVIVE
jgi:hypothetical protein